MIVDEVSSPGGSALRCPDSRRLAIGHADGSIRLYDLPSGRQLKQLDGFPSHGRLAFHPNGRQLAVSCATGIQVYDLETGRMLADFRAARTNERAWPGTLTARRWQQAATTRGFISGTSPLGKQTHVLEGSRNGGIAIAFNHAGDLLASGGWEGILRLWDTRTGTQLFSMPAWRIMVASILDDRLLAHDVRDGKQTSWEVAAGGEYRTLVRAAAAGQGHYDNAGYPFGRTRAGRGNA